MAPPIVLTKCVVAPVYFKTEKERKNESEVSYNWHQITKIIGKLSIESEYVSDLSKSGWIEPKSYHKLVDLITWNN